MSEHQHPARRQPAITRESYDELYRSAPAVWTGRPNRQLVVEATDLPPGAALDAGAGEGGDALWLASRGWQVTAVDFSPVALGRGAAKAAELLLADRIQWRHEDLETWAPPAARVSRPETVSPEPWSTSVAPAEPVRVVVHFPGTAVCDGLMDAA